MDGQRLQAREGVKENRFLEVWRQFRRNKGAMIGLVIVFCLILIALLSDVIWDYEKDVIALNVPQRLSPPSLEHPFGTDEYGRDMLARVGYGTKYSLLIGFCSVMVAVVVGLPIGAASGYIGGRFDAVFMRIIDAITIIPSILMTVLLVTILGTSLGNLMIALAISSIPILARVTRAAVMTVRYNEYVESAKAIGASDLYIIVRYILPNCFSSILVQATLRMGASIIGASGLSYIGLGVPKPTPEWGALLNASKTYIADNAYLCLFPGLAIMITVMAINLVGDGLRDALDPKLKR